MLVSQPVVVVPARVAALLAPLLRDVTRRAAARDGIVVDPEVRQVLDELDQLARAVRNIRNPNPQVSEDPGTVGIGAEGGSVIVGDVMGVSQVAARLHVSDRRVRALAVAGRLPGRKTPRGRWEFDRLDVDEFERNRHERTR